MASIDIINNSTTLECVPQSNSSRMNLGSETRAPSVIDANWIRSKINMRRCTYFVPTEESNEICHCGYEKEHHTHSHINKSNSDISITNSKWDFSKHTKTEPTNAFGEIEFVGREVDIKPKFVRVDIQTDMSVMMEMFKREGMEIPKLLISVAGDSNDFQKKAKLRNGLMKTAHDIGAWIITGGTWIITGGTQADVPEPDMTLKENVVIGIAPWGVIHHRKVLESSAEQKGLWPAKYDTTATEELKDNEIVLDPTHSYYILVDDGTQHRLDIEIPFRVKLEQKIAKMKTKAGNDVLIVKLVLGGGQGTLKMVDEALKQDTPVVVVKGSGGAADIFAYAFQHATSGDEDDNSNDGQDRNRNENHMTQSLKDKIEEEMKKKKINCSIDVINRCLLKSNLIHIFDLASDEYKIDAVLLKALMRAYRDSVKNQIKGKKHKYAIHP